MDMLIWTIVLALVGVLAGWLAPMVVKARRPYGMGGDIAAGVVIMVGLGLLWWYGLMPLFNFPQWLNIAAVFGDPLGLTLIVLWLMRTAQNALCSSRCS